MFVEFWPQAERPTLRPRQQEMKKLFGRERHVPRRQPSRSDRSGQDCLDACRSFACPGLAQHQRQFGEAGAFGDQQAVQGDGMAAMAAYEKFCFGSR